MLLENQQRVCCLYWRKHPKGLEKQGRLYTVEVGIPLGQNTAGTQCPTPMRHTNTAPPTLKSPPHTLLPSV